MPVTGVLGPSRSPVSPIQQGQMGALGNLNQALQSNNAAYGGLQNQAQQQYQQNAGAVQQNLANNGLGNTTVAQNMMQAPMQTYNNQMLNLAGQQNAGNTGIYGQMANVNMGGGQSLAQLQNAMQMAQMQQQTAQQQMGNQAGMQGAALSANSQQNAQNALQQMMMAGAMWDQGGGNGDPYAMASPVGS